MKKVVIQKFFNMLMKHFIIKDKDDNIWHACKPTLMYDKNAIVEIKTEDTDIGINIHNDHGLVFNRIHYLDTLEYIEKLKGIINDLKIENEYLQKYNTFLENQLKNKK